MAKTKTYTVEFSKIVPYSIDVDARSPEEAISKVEKMSRDNLLKNATDFDVEFSDFHATEN